MRTLLILVAILGVTSAGRVRCRGATIIDSIKQEVEVLYKVGENLDSPYQLAMDYETDTLFFSLSVNSTDVSFQTAKLNLKTKEFEKVSESGFAQAVDTNNNIVYLGGVDGIFKYDYETKQAVLVENTEDINIWQLFHKDNLYFTTHPDERAFVLKDGKPTSVPELENTKVILLALDNDRNIYFSNSSGVYLHEKSNSEVSYIGNYTLNAFTTDKDGHVYFSTLEGLYRIKDLKTVELLTSFDYIYGMAIDADGNIIYSTETELIRLKPTSTRCPSKKKSH